MEEVLYLQLLPPHDQDKHDDMIVDELLDIRRKYPDQNIAIVHGTTEKHVKQTKYQNYQDISSLYFNNIRSYGNIINKLSNIYDAQQFAFKINVSYGYVFEVEADQEYFYRLGHGYDDKRLLDEPMLIRNRRDFDKLIEKLELRNENDFISKVVDRYEQDTKTKAIGIYQLFVKVYLLNDPIGAQIKIPDVLLNSKTVYTLIKIIWE